MTVNFFVYPGINEIKATLETKTGRVKLLSKVGAGNYYSVYNDACIEAEKHRIKK